MTLWVRFDRDVAGSDENVRFGRCVLRCINESDDGKSVNNAANQLQIMT